jgi:hypothetical protein
VTPDWLAPVIGGTGGGGAIALLLLRRGLSRFDRMEERVHNIEVQMAGALATKDDVDKVSDRLDRVDAALNGVQMSLARLEGQLNPVLPRKE